MATISKFYLHDAATPNAGTMPSGVLHVTSSADATTGDATGARTARDATNVIGTANPDTESTITANADTNQQLWGHRRFVSRPLAAHTFDFTDGNWTFSYARTESNLNHNQSIRLCMYLWRPSTGAIVGTLANDSSTFVGSEPASASTETAESLTQLFGASATTIALDGDILVFDVTAVFTQGMATAYTEQFAYDGTTEASTTTCASFVTPPAALTLYTPAAHSLIAYNRTPRNTLLRR